MATERGSRASLHFHALQVVLEAGLRQGLPVLQAWSLAADDWQETKYLVLSDDARWRTFAVPAGTYVGTVKTSLPLAAWQTAAAIPLLTSRSEASSSHVSQVLAAPTVVPATTTSSAAVLWGPRPLLPVQA
eukprot:GILK01018571.1.p1 GENE.GILK01018571.1~~GILK01018571.1.p1  ORF type:complete len:131 (+),score=0.18 GILK01018571.1:77-469(+)